MVSGSSNVSSPSVAGTLEQFIIPIPGAVIDKTYSFALQAYDDAELASPVSNYVQGRFQASVKPVESGLSAGIIAIIASAIAVTIAVIIVVVILCKRRKDKKTFN